MPGSGSICLICTCCSTAHFLSSFIKNYEYYQYVQEHGGYLQFWVNHGDIAASVPLVVRAIVLVSLPAFVAIFVFEKRKKYLYLATAAYLLTSIPTLLLGLRGGVFALVLTLWYVAAVKSTKKSRMLVVAALALSLVLVGDVIQTLREDTDTTLSDYTFAPLEFVRLQGNSLDVTSAAVKYRSIFAPYAGSYLRHELENAFVASDTTNYFRGKSLAFDVAVLLNADAFSNGRGTGGSYIGEAYVLGALPGVLIISLLIGCGLQFCHRASQERALLVPAGAGVARTYSPCPGGTCWTGCQCWAGPSCRSQFWSWDGSCSAGCYG